MSRRKSIASIDAQICTCKKKIAKAKERYDKLCDELQTLVGGRGGFYTNARVKIGHWRHQMHTILAHSYPSVAS